MSIIIHVEGGLVQSVHCLGMETIIVVDEDTDCSDEPYYISEFGSSGYTSGMELLIHAKEENERAKES